MYVYSFLLFYPKIKYLVEILRKTFITPNSNHNWFTFSLHKHIWSVKHYDLLSSTLALHGERRNI